MDDWPSGHEGLNFPCPHRRSAGAKAEEGRFVQDGRTASNPKHPSPSNRTPQPRSNHTLSISLRDRVLAGRMEAF